MTLPSACAPRTGRRPIALESSVIVPARPFFMGRPGRVRSSAWIWLFSSTQRTKALSGGLRVEPDHILHLGGEVAVTRTFEVSIRCGFSPCLLQIR